MLTAYEKKEKSVSASSTDIETEPEGKRNGTATPPNGLSEDKVQTAASEPHGLASEDKGNALPGEKQTASEESFDFSPGDTNGGSGVFNLPSVEAELLEIAEEAERKEIFNLLKNGRKVK